MPLGSAVACLVALVLPASTPTRPPSADALETGDLAFHTSRSAQSKGIQAATRSPWSHVGLVEVAPDGVFVLEAVGRVSRTPWRDFAARGERGEVLVLRPRSLGAAARERVLAEARRHLGKPYDAAFGWGDERLYCSELVWKAYARGARLELGRRERLGDLHVRGLDRELQARFGRVPRELVLVTPASLAADPRLAPVPAAR
jgi:cell wall-associated NlpC family hydrolase